MFDPGGNPEQILAAGTIHKQISGVSCFYVDLLAITGTLVLDKHRK